MREIKFRAWDKNRKAMMYGDELVLCARPYILIKQYGSEPDWSVQTDSLMQYTGLKDKNGKEIYEGDVVNFSTCNGKQGVEAVTYVANYGTASYEPFSNCGICGESWANNPEVIGNIYENPELLK